MKVLLFSLLGLVTLCGAPVYIRAGFVTSERFLQLPQNEREALTAGIVSGIYLSPIFGAPDKGQTLEALEGCLKGMSAAQLAAMVEKRVRDNPRLWNTTLSLQTIETFRASCPEFAVALSNAP